METKTETEAIHPLGEGEFAFPTPGGRVRLSVTNDTLTPFGGLVPWAAYTKHIGIIDRLAGSCPVQRTSPNASPVYDVLQSFVLTALTDGRRFSHIERLREDPAIPEIFGMESVIGDDTVQDSAALTQLKISSNSGESETYLLNTMLVHSLRQYLGHQETFHRRVDKHYELEENLVVVARFALAISIL